LTYDLDLDMGEYVQWVSVRSMFYRGDNLSVKASFVLECCRWQERKLDGAIALPLTEILIAHLEHRPFGSTMPGLYLVMTVNDWIGFERDEVCVSRLIF
jgi:hypothetical protein